MIGAVLAEIQHTTEAYKHGRPKPQDGLRCGRGKVVVVQRERRACTKSQRGEKTLSKRRAENKSV